MSAPVQTYAPPRSVCVVNDQVSINRTYRADLIAQLTARGFQIRQAGLFEGGRFRLWHLLWLAVQWRTPVVSSNLRSNLCVLMLLHLRGLVILNGLGRNRQSRPLRLALIGLIKLNRRKSVVVQNYADFRYFRRFGRSVALDWVPGSGGVPRRVGSVDAAVVVQRDDKICLVAPSLRRFLTQDTPFKAVWLVGCSDSSDALNDLDVRATGHVPQEDLFAQGRIFLQPAGYGEGMPHSLVDAIASGMEIWIDHRLYLQTGLSRLGASIEEKRDGWARLAPASAGLVRALGVHAITTLQLDLFERASGLAQQPGTRAPEPPFARSSLKN